MPELNLSTLNCVYFALFFVGVGYALFIVVTGGISDVDLPDVDIDIPGADIDISGLDNEKLSANSVYEKANP